MAITVSKPKAPLILLTGLRTLPNGTELQVTRYEVHGETIKDSDKHFTKHPEFLFSDTVDIQLFSDAYRLKNYAAWDEGEKKFVGTFLDDGSVEKGEVRFSINGGDPLRGGYRLYKKGFTLRFNASNSSYTIRARIYRLGQWSDVTKITVRLKNG